MIDFAHVGIERGVNPKALQKLLGHDNIAMTMDTYVGVSDVKVDVEAKKINQLTGR